LAQAERYAAAIGEWPVVALDDLPSELDQAHQRAVIALAIEVGAQVLITGTEMPAALRDIAAPVHMFHVEHGRVSAAP
jgi:DNA replication and repair protein RecF